MRLNHKIILVTSATLIAALLLSAMTIVQNFRSHYTNALLSGAFGIGYSVESVLNEMLALGLPLDSLAGMGDRLQDVVRKNEHIAYIGITDLYSTVIFHSNPELVGRDFRDPVALKSIAAKEPIWQFYNRFDGKQYYDITIPVFDVQQRHIGVIRLGFETAHVDSQVNQALAQFFGIGLLSFLLMAFFINLLLRHFVTAPVQQLSAFAKAITDNRLSQNLTIPSRDEIGDLSRALTAMRDTIRQQLVELQQLNEEMEIKVLERTKALKLANTQLVERNDELNEALDRERELSDALRHSEENFRRLFEKNKAVMLIINPATKGILAANHAAIDYYGYDEGQLIGMNMNNINTLSAAEINEEMAKATAERRNHFLFQHRLASGEVRDVEVHSGPIDWQGFPALYSIVHDITERKLAEDELDRMAHYDTLTGLPNRVLLSDRLHQAMAQVKRHDKMLAVLFLDLDGFKEINDTHGHQVGDRLLIELTGRMKQLLREEDTLARLGGDEFVAVLLDLDTEEDSVPILDRLLATAAEPVLHNELRLQVSASLGVTFFPQRGGTDNLDADQLLRQADQAMYHAKQAGKNRYHIFDTELDRSVRDHNEILGRINEGITKQEFVLFYQPKVNMRTGEVIGAEALIRWQHPERGLLPPVAFLPALENHQLGLALGDWVLREGIGQMVAWKLQGLQLPVSINIDAYHLQQKDFVERLQRVIADHPEVQPGDIELEVLETSALENIAHVSTVINRCREIGINFALDDFGTGYSSLLYLKQIPANLLKIDQSFVRDMLDDPEDLAILDGVLGLANAFRHDAIAEGVETFDHGEMLLQLGCELGQGYAIARPMPAEEIPAWLSAWRPQPTWLDRQPLGRDHQALIFAIVEHRSWVAQLQRILQENDGTAPEMDIHACRFGQWLDNHASYLFAEEGQLDEVIALHRTIHDQAVNLLAGRDSRSADENRQGMQQIETLRDQLIHSLKQLVA